MIETDSTVRAIPAPQTAEVRRVALPAKRWKYALSESNPLVLDFAQFHLGDGVWSHRDEVLKADTSLRRRIGIVPRSWREIQPWKQPAPKKSFPVWTRWVFNISGAVPDDLELVIERQEGSKQVLINEQNVLLKDAGWWVDPCFRRHLVKGDCLRSGINEIVCRMDYNQRNGLEAMYLLSSRAVAADSRGSTLFPAPQSLRMGDIAQQGLPFYAAGVRYRQTVKVDLHSRERAFVVLRKWAGIGVVVRLDGREVGVIAWPPYEIELPALRGEHELEIEVMLGRQNTFGPLHWRGKRDPWVSPQSFESTGEQWQDDYRIDPGGLLQAPILSIRK